ncbi:MAG: orotidine-5'-phosphate decarboxylase [Culicoidibacterales bacterium]
MIDILIACDVKNKAELTELLAPFGTQKLFLKIGMELYYHEGKALIHELKGKGHRIFLDLKLHDIPNTVTKALASLADLEVDYLTVHAAGGLKMLKACVAAVKGTKTKILAVTVLTSLDQNALEQELNINLSLENCAQRYATMASKAGIHGCICSAFEVLAIKKQVNNADFLCITPGIRLLGDDSSDQARVATPSFAIAQKADGLVIGRTITQSPTPYQTYKKIEEEISHV